MPIISDAAPVWVDEVYGKDAVMKKPGFQKKGTTSESIGKLIMNIRTLYVCKLLVRIVTR